MDPSAPQASETPRELDLRGLKCPLPALKTQAALAKLPVGCLLRVETTDPLAALDIPHLLQQSGDSLLRVEAGVGATIFLIRKG